MLKLIGFILVIEVYLYGCIVIDSVVSLLEFKLVFFIDSVIFIVIKIECCFFIYVYFYIGDY